MVHLKGETMGFPVHRGEISMDMTNQSWITYNLAFPLFSQQPTPLQALSWHSSYSYSVNGGANFDLKSELTVLYHDGVSPFVLTVPNIQEDWAAQISYTASPTNQSAASQPAYLGLILGYQAPENLQTKMKEEGMEIWGTTCHISAATQQEPGAPHGDRKTQWLSAKLEIDLNMLQKWATGQPANGALDTNQWKIYHIPSVAREEHNAPSPPLPDSQRLVLNPTSGHVVIGEAGTLSLGLYAIAKPVK
jgi:cytochrome c5